MSIVGVFIFIMVCYTIYGLLTDTQDEIIDLLKKSYKALEQQSEKVEKIHNGFHWKKYLSSGDANSIDIYITAEKKEDMDKAFWRTNDDEKYGFFFRFVYELTEEVCEKIIGDDTMKSYTGHLNSFARLCDPLKVTPYLTKITQENGKIFYEFSHFALVNKKDIEIFEDRFKKIGAAETIKELAHSVFDGYNDFSYDFDNTYVGRVSW